MYCPECGSKTRVLYTDMEPDETVRKRECLKCKYTFFTSESDMDWGIGDKIMKKHHREKNKRSVLRRYNKDEK